jgi:hypothetical protein
LCKTDCQSDIFLVVKIDSCSKLTQPSHLEDYCKYYIYVDGGTAAAAALLTKLTQSPSIQVMCSLLGMQGKSRVKKMFTGHIIITYIFYLQIINNNTLLSTV